MVTAVANEILKKNLSFFQATMKKHPVEIEKGYQIALCYLFVYCKGAIEWYCSKYSRIYKF